jgi:hypothetical protein
MAPTPPLPRFAGFDAKGVGRAACADDPSPAKRGRVAARSAVGWGLRHIGEPAR